MANRSKEFIRRWFRIWWALMGCAAFTFLGVYVAAFNKSNAWTVWGVAIFGAIASFIASYRVWNQAMDEAEDWKLKCADWKRKFEDGVDAALTSRRSCGPLRIESARWTCVNDPTAFIDVVEALHGRISDDSLKVLVNNDLGDPCTRFHPELGGHAKMLHLKYSRGKSITVLPNEWLKL